MLLVVSLFWKSAVIALSTYYKDKCIYIYIYVCVCVCAGTSWNVGCVDGSTDGWLLQAHACKDSPAAHLCPVLHARAPQGLVINPVVIRSAWRFCFSSDTIVRAIFQPFSRFNYIYMYKLEHLVEEAGKLQLHFLPCNCKFGIHE